MIMALICLKESKTRLQSRKHTSKKTKINEMYRNNIVNPYGSNISSDRSQDSLMCCFPKCMSMATAGSFFNSHRANSVVGRLMGAIDYTSYSAFQIVHSVDHHVHVGTLVNTALNDLAEHIAEHNAMILWTREDWDSWPLWRKCCLRLVRNLVSRLTLRMIHMNWFQGSMLAISSRKIAKSILPFA